MAKILLGVTGSVAAIHTRELFETFAGAGHDVKIVATGAAEHFFDPAQIAPRQANLRNKDVVVLDQDEWPTPGYRRGAPVLHIELRRWAEVLVIAPLDAHTLAKIAMGLCDNCLTCVYRAWDRNRPIVLAPAMNTLMWEHPATARHFAQVAEDVTGSAAPRQSNALALIEWINAAKGKLAVVPPVVKTLACADQGMGGLADRVVIADTIENLLKLPHKAPS